MNYLSNHYDDLTESERRLLHYVLENQKQVIKMTCRHLAETCGVSKTVVINMAQKLGFEGYNDFKFYLKNQQPKLEEPLAEESIENEIISSVTKTIDLCEEKVYDSVARRIIKAKCVYVVSRGTSKAVGLYLSHLLLMANIKCINLPDLNLLGVLAHQLSEDELLIAISLSGETVSVVDTVKVATARGNKVIALTAFKNSSLSRYSDISLYCASSNTNTKSHDMNTRVSFFVIVDILIQHVQKLLGN